MKTLWTALTEQHRLHIVELLRDGTVVELALDAKGRQVFYQLYRGFPLFLRCK